MSKDLEDRLRTLSPEEQKNVKPITEEQIMSALKEGAERRRAALYAMCRAVTPIAKIWW